MSIGMSEGFAELGMWQDAWEGLEHLASDERASPAALRVRLRCCPHLDAWEEGEHVADLLRGGGVLDRNAAATFYHENARRLLKEGDKPAAAASIKAALDVWPDYRFAILLDPMLADEFI